MKLAIIDDHAMVRSGIAAVLKSSLAKVTCVAEASNPDMLLDEYGQLEFDLILLDYHIPGMVPKDNYEVLNAHYPGARIMFLSSDENSRIIAECINLGAAGYVVKSSNMELLLATIEFVLAGGTYIPAHVLNESSGSHSQMAADNAFADLTQRQREVFDLLLEGHPNKKIASLLCISENTVKSHLMAAFRTLSLSSRTEAIKQYRQ